jgi:hypothetical protein
MVQFRMVFVVTSLDRFGMNKIFYEPFSIIKWSRLVDHPKTGPICAVLGWSILGYPVLVNMDHLKSGFVRFLDPHCIVVILKIFFCSSSYHLFLHIALSFRF